MVDVGTRAVVHNVRPAGQIRPATSPDVARDVQQEKRLFKESELALSLQWITKVAHLGLIN